MTVRITKDSINLREEISRLNKPSGVAGEAMLRAETPQEQFNLIGAGRKNLIINGDFKVSQRGDYTTETAVSPNNGYFVDRFKCAYGNIAANLVVTPDVYLPNGDRTTSLKVTATGGATSGYVAIRTIIEGYKVLTNQTVTVSCWMRSNHPYAGIRQDSVTDRSSKHSGNGEWEYITATWKYGTLTGDDGTSTGTTIAFITYNNANVSMNTGDYIEIAQVQLELGTVATPFEHRSYGEELALCQRYYQRWTGTAYAQIPSLLIATNSTDAQGFITYKVPMRATPTLTSSTLILTQWDAQWTINTLTLTNATAEAASLLAFTGGTLVDNDPYHITTNNNATHFLALSAEL